MLATGVVVIVSLAYLGLLFAIAWFGDRRAKTGRSLIRSPVVYTFSLAVYCTSWTFYGAVGTAARRGIEFITIYTGPTIVFLGWWFLLRKIARISKTQRITSIADFVAARYGKSATLGMIVTVIAVVGTMPYIALQLKAVSSTFAVLVNYDRFADVGAALSAAPPAILSDAAFLTAIGMAIFAILFGTRHIGLRSSPSSSAPATSTPTSTMRGWSRRSPSNPASSSSPSSPSASSSFSRSARASARPARSRRRR